MSNEFKLNTLLYILSVFSKIKLYEIFFGKYPRKVIFRLDLDFWPWPTFFLALTYIFDLDLDFWPWPTFFLALTYIFDLDLDFWPWPRFLTLTYIFDLDLDFWPWPRFLTLTYIFDLDLDLWPWPWPWPLTLTLTSWPRFFDDVKMCQNPPIITTAVTLVFYISETNCFPSTLTVDSNRKLHRKHTYRAAMPKVATGVVFGHGIWDT
jgi:hypothetical protein